jgi:uncharacterized protein YeaO (DUF488 family)
MPIKIKRIYDPPAKTNGTRVLVDRLWPRSITKEKARIDEWLKEIAPSDELRQWFGHKPERWEEFQIFFSCFDHLVTLEYKKSSIKR